MVAAVGQAARSAQIITLIGVLYGTLIHSMAYTPYGHGHGHSLHLGAHACDCAPPGCAPRTSYVVYSSGIWGSGTGLDGGAPKKDQFQPIIAGVSSKTFEVNTPKNKRA